MDALRIDVERQRDAGAAQVPLTAQQCGELGGGIRAARAATGSSDPSRKTRRSGAARPLHSRSWCASYRRLVLLDCGLARRIAVDPALDLAGKLGHRSDELPLVDAEHDLPEDRQGRASSGLLVP